MTSLDQVKKTPNVLFRGKKSAFFPAWFVVHGSILPESFKNPVESSKRVLGGFWKGSGRFWKVLE